MPRNLQGRRRLLPILPLTLLLLAGSPAPAPQTTQKPAEPGTGDKSVEKDRERLPQRAFSMDPIEIMGETEKPKTMFVIPKAPTHYAGDAGKKDFTPDILVPINKQWVEDMQRWRESAETP
jgi:hypothetical protein